MSEENLSDLPLFGQGETIIESNGCFLEDEREEGFEALFEALKNETIEERFFTPISYICRNKGARITVNQCPIELQENGYTHFFGNFEGLSHVFDILSNDVDFIKKLLV